MFEFTVLGCYAPFPAVSGACSGYLLSIGDCKVLIDCGSGVLANLGKIVDFRRGGLDAVILSHLHHDHVSDFWLMRYAVAFTENGNLVLPVFAPDEPCEMFQMLPFQGIELSVIEPGIRTIAGARFHFFRTEHPIPCFGMRVEYKGATFVYTADTSYTAGLLEVAQGADLLLCECSLRDEDAALRKRGHMTSSDAGKLAAHAGAKRLVLTHFWPDHDRRQLVAEAKAHCECLVDPAVIGQTWRIAEE